MMMLATAAGGFLAECCCLTASTWRAVGAGMSASRPLIYLTVKSAALGAGGIEGLENYHVCHHQRLRPCDDIVKAIELYLRKKTAIFRPI
jgi:hypothetical protein